MSVVGWTVVPVRDHVVDAWFGLAGRQRLRVVSVESSTGSVTTHGEEVGEEET